MSSSSGVKPAPKKPWPGLIHCPLCGGEMAVWLAGMTRKEGECKACSAYIFVIREGLGHYRFHVKESA